MNVSKDDVLYTAALARLEFTEGESEALQRDLNSILKYFEKLSELDTSSILPTAHIFKLKGELREDVVQPSLSREDALSNAKFKMDGCFKVPRILE